MYRFFLLLLFLGDHTNQHPPMENKQSYGQALAVAEAESRC